MKPSVNKTKIKSPSKVSFTVYRKYEIPVKFKVVGLARFEHEEDISRSTWTC